MDIAGFTLSVQRDGSVETWRMARDDCDFVESVTFDRATTPLAQQRLMIVGMAHMAGFNFGEYLDQRGMLRVTGQA